MTKLNINLMNKKFTFDIDDFHHLTKIDSNGSTMFKKWHLTSDFKPFYINLNKKPVYLLDKIMNQK